MDDLRLRSSFWMILDARFEDMGFYTWLYTPTYHNRPNVTDTAALLIARAIRSHFSATHSRANEALSDDVR